MIKNCNNCQVEFKTKPYSIRIGKGKFCSKECVNTYKTGKRNDWARGYTNCGVCGISIYRAPSVLSKINQAYCSNKCYGISKIGKASHNKGVPMSEETKKKLSLALKGRTPVNKGVRASYRAEQHWNWKGGVQSENRTQRVRFSKYFQNKVLERDNYTCQLCGVRGVNLQVDHIQPWSEYIELRFCMDNCRTLCASCHYKITFGKPMPPTVKAWGHNLLKSEILT